ncbi:hypothetical protein NKJ71_19585 [Mesorhizobium sp. M0050]|uniref:hypothetical protein n=1 Tax=Mesorhizobium sp. M0050 TaxID=2956861 RepID=UPI003337DE85
MTRQPIVSFHASCAVGLATVTIVLGALAISIGESWPHQVPGMSTNYPPECCNSAATSPNGDCAPIDDRYVTEQPDGYHINLPAGAHPRLKTHGYSEIIPYSARRQPLDNSYHICLSDEGQHRFCFFPKPGSV